MSEGLGYAWEVFYSSLSYVHADVQDLEFGSLCSSEFWPLQNSGYHEGSTASLVLRRRHDVCNSHPQRL